MSLNLELSIDINMETVAISQQFAFRFLPLSRLIKKQK